MAETTTDPVAVTGMADVMTAMVAAVMTVVAATMNATAALAPAMGPQRHMLRLLPEEGLTRIAGTTGTIADEVVISDSFQVSK